VESETDHFIVVDLSQMIKGASQKRKIDHVE
jgi:hypothetical protein